MISIIFWKTSLSMYHTDYANMKSFIADRPQKLDMKVCPGKQAKRSRATSTARDG